jgi:uncharacterized protein DUF1801
MLSETPEYLEFLKPYSPEVQDLHRAARRRLLEVLPPVCEIVYDAVSALTVGFSFTTEVKDHFIYLPASARHILLGFVWGKSFHDPKGLLQGGGNQTRHIKLTSLDPLENPDVLAFIEQAVAGARRPSEPVEPVSVIKVMNGPKRRPKY